MPSPFPGMDPYLETPEIFPDVHAGLITAIQHALNPRLGPNYVARIELRVYVEEIDREFDRIQDVRIETSTTRTKHSPSNGGLMIAEPIIVLSLLLDPIEETYLTIRHRESKALVAVLEVMSPSNKVNGSEGRKSFMDKRREVLSSSAHWIEIDLLRGGSRSGPPRMTYPIDYRVLVARGDESGVAKCWPISIRQKLPVIGIPLKDPDPDVPLDLAAVLVTVYEGGAYDRSIEYDKPPHPPLASDDAKWANKLLRTKGVR